MEGIIPHWKSNIKKNIKVISVILGDIMIAIILVFIYALQVGWDWNTVIFGVVIGCKPYLIMLVNIWTKGDVGKIETNNSLLKLENTHLIEKNKLESEKTDFIKKLVYEREIAEYRCQLAARDGKVPDAIKRTSDWDLLNTTIEKTETKAEHMARIEKELEILNKKE